MEGSSEHGNKSSDFIKCWKVKKGPAARVSE
jgi:hypothetical protein